MKRIVLAALVALAPPAASVSALAGETNVAVAANFTDAAREIAAAFEAKTGHRAVLSFGSTGQLYAQITQGAPFTVLLAADDERPQKAVDEGLAVSGTVFPYAIGRLVLWSKEPGRVIGAETLTSGAFTKIAIANPKAAPYGAAAIEVMKGLGVHAALEPRIVQGNSIAQTFQFVDTGNAEVGFVALSQVITRDEGSRWIVPETLHAPIRQDAVLLKTGAEDEVARAFMDFLKGPETARVIQKYGYGAAANG